MFIASSWPCYLTQKENMGITGFLLIPATRNSNFSPQAKATKRKEISGFLTVAMATKSLTLGKWILNEITEGNRDRFPRNWINSGTSGQNFKIYPFLLCVRAFLDVWSSLCPKGNWTSLPVHMLIDMFSLLR